jgi:hypothetical protein
VVGSVTFIGIFSFFCTVIRFSAIKVPSLNDIRFMMFGYQPEAFCLVSQLLEIRRC